MPTSSLDVAEISRDVAPISVVVAAISLAVACCSLAVAAISVTDVVDLHAGLLHLADQRRQLRDHVVETVGQDAEFIRRSSFMRRVKSPLLTPCVSATNCPSGVTILLGDVISNDAGQDQRQDNGGDYDCTGCDRAGFDGRLRRQRSPFVAARSDLLKSIDSGCAKRRGRCGAPVRGFR